MFGEPRRCTCCGKEIDYWEKGEILYCKECEDTTLRYVNKLIDWVMADCGKCKRDDALEVITSVMERYVW